MDYEQERNDRHALGYLVWKRTRGISSVDSVHGDVADFSVGGEKNDCKE